MCFILRANHVQLAASITLGTYGAGIYSTSVRINGHLSANQKTVIQQPPPRPASTPTETQQSVLTSVQQEMAARRKANISRQDSRLSVKCLIESIENATKQAKTGKTVLLNYQVYQSNFSMI